MQLNKEKTKKDIWVQGLRWPEAVVHFQVVLTSPQLSTFSSEKGQQRDDTEAIGADQHTRQERKITAGRGRVSLRQCRGVVGNVSGKFGPGAASRSWVTRHRSLHKIQHKLKLRDTSDGIGCTLCLLSSSLQARMCVNWSGTEAVAMGTKRGGGGVWPRLEPVGP